MKKRSKKKVKKPIKKKAVKKPVKKKITKRKSIKKKIAKKRVVKKKPAKKKAAKKRPVKKRAVKKPAKKKLAKRKVKPKKKIIKKRKVAKKSKKRVVKKKRAVKKRLAKKKAKKRVIKKKKKVTKRRVVKRKPKKRVIKKKRPVKRKRVKVKRRRRRKKIRVIRRVYSGGGPLEQLFESPGKVQIMKLFFRNPEANFLLKEAAKIMRNNLASVRKEMKRLEKIGLLKSRKISPRKEVFAINPNFDFFNELRELILRASPISKEKMLKAVRGLGKIKLVLLSGLFMGNEPSRADLLIVGDNINQRKLNTFIKNLEAEAGTGINCVVMTTEEFNYRYDMYDRFVRDLLNEKCEFLVNRLNK